MTDQSLPPEVEAEVAVTAAEMNMYINQALDRVIASEPHKTVAMAVSFMALVDFLGEEVKTTTVAEFLLIFAEMYQHLARSDEE